MTPNPSFSVTGKRVVVVGAARSGVAAAELLVRRGATVTLTDLRETIAEDAQLRDAGVHLELGGHRPQTLLGADLIVLSPGVPPAHPAIADARAAGVPVMGELELASRWVRGRVVAITGTKGKSTTTTLAGLHPWIAVLLNFSPDHLDRHADIAEYAAAKARIFANQTSDDWAVLNADDEASQVIAQDARSQRLLFALERELRDGIVVAGDAIVRRSGGGEHVLVPLSAVKLLGRHLLADVAAAAAVASLAGVEPDAMTRAVEGFTGLEHALEPVTEVGGVRFVNDSKATNIESALRAIQSFDAGLVVIAGGRFKGGTFVDLRDALVARSASVVAIGEAAPLIHQALEPAIPVHDAADMAAAVRTAFAVASPGDTVLLAPACASFDMFVNYAERGRAFKREVRRLAEEWSETREQ